MSRPTVLERFSDDPLLSPGADVHALADALRDLAEATLRAVESVRAGDAFADADLDAAERLARKVLR
jgi:hypothetical protein